MKTTLKLERMKKYLAGFMLFAFAVSSFGISEGEFKRVANAATLWNATGNYVIAMNYLGTDYLHDMSLTHNISNDVNSLAGNGGSPAGANVYTWQITSGSVTDNSIEFDANYTATADAVNPQTVLHVEGTIAEDGTISGTWSDNYQAGERQGTFATVSGAANPVEQDAPKVKVTIQKYVDGALATALSSNNADFPMSATWNAENIGAGTGQYVLSENGFGGDTTPYQAITAEMSSGASYSTHEITNTDVVGTSCDIEGTDYALIGYTHGNTLAEAKAATPSLVAPSFTNLTSDKFVLVLNDNCATKDVGGEIEGDVISGNGVLAVTSIETVDGQAVANGTFEDGWKYVFNITVPSDETDLSMKFADWVRNGGSETIPVAGNIRISSAQANNAGATVLITAPNTYSSPALVMTGDLDPATSGMQIKVVVEVKIPAGTANGSYTTSYGVRTE